MLRFVVGLSAMVVLLTGCGIGGVWLEPSNRPSRTEYPYGARWVKDGMTRESRLADWMACGGGHDLQAGFRDPINNEPWAQYESQRVPFIQAQTACMQSKGYEFKFHSRPGLPDQCDARTCLYP